METMYLQGAEQVQRASSQMTSASEQMSRAASTIEHALHRHQQFLDEWLMRLEAALSKEG